MKKIFILDTNVLIHDPEAMFSFDDNDVYLPIYVIEEIDKLKEYNDRVGKSARETSRNIEKLRKEEKNSNLSLLEGLKNSTGGTFRIVLGENDSVNIPDSLNKNLTDNKIIGQALRIKNENKKRKVILVSKDMNVRIKANVLGMETVDYVKDQIDINQLYEGWKEIEISNDLFSLLEKAPIINWDLVLKEEPKANELIRFKNSNKEILTIYKKEREKLEKQVFADTKVWGVFARNTEQKQAMELLMDERIKLVTLVGKAGTGKTLLAIATALEQVVERKLYKKIFIARPIVPMGNDIGFLPGTEKEKMQPWMLPIYDNIEFLASNKGQTSSNEAEKVVAGLESLGLLKVEPLTYIRGRSIPQGFIIIDEAQNLTPHEVKTIITRVGKDTKIVFTGDPDQIDNPYLDANSNGLAYIAEKMKNEILVGHIRLVKGERSEISELASRLL
ncbi:MAG: PhoH family protein [Leptotrichiaceae bacterium]|jgi:PhoH-like ATPase|nr:PhoH family protein [Leptotrichiaceae bacterium]MBP8637464.1 PhoH family protein [Leptotrichiaceae bacterium]MBP9539201.1 PhoH family protein [Leptotrichiaceae bacterium]MBP9876651.1 PhoH family protein [Leptotrichiaceae bacterium]